MWFWFWVYWKVLILGATNIMCYLWVVPQSWVVQIQKGKMIEVLVCAWIRDCFANFRTCFFLCGTCRGAALPTNTPGIPCIFDPDGRAGICGDWLLGSSLESAALSGMALGNHVSATLIFLIWNELSSRLVYSDWLSGLILCGWGGVQFDSWVLSLSQFRD